MKTKMSATLILQLCFLSILNAQVTQGWLARYNSSGNKDDTPTSMAIDDSNNVYVTGFTSTGWYTYDEDFLTVKYNSSGVEQWARTYNGSFDSTDKAFGIAVDRIGNVYVTGSSIYDKFGECDIVVIKYNSTGNQQWLYRTPSNTFHSGFPTSIVTDDSGYVYISGLTYYSNQTFTTIKLNAGGKLQWIANEPDMEGWITALKVDSSGNVYVAGMRWYNQEDYVTIKYNSSGQRRWEAIYDGITELSNAEPTSIALDKLGNVYVTGYSDRNDNNYDFLTIKYNSSGTRLWTTTYDGPAGGSDYACSIAVDDSGNAFVTGKSTGVGTYLDYATIKYNSSGVQQWCQRYDGPNSMDDIPSDLVLDSSENVYVTGSCYQWGHDFATIKYNSSGVQQWLKQYDGGGTDAAISVKVGASGKVYVSGPSSGDNGYNDYVTIEYSQTSTGVYQTASDFPSDNSLSQNFPNPFNPSTVIGYHLATNSNVVLKVFDLLGRQVRTLVNERQTAGNHSVRFDGATLPSGVYFYKLESGTYHDTKRLLLLK